MCDNHTNSPQFNVTEVVMELDSSSQEIRRTVTLISESESKIQAARTCPMMKCAPLLGCAARKKDENGCQTCECAGRLLNLVYWGLFHYFLS